MEIDKSLTAIILAAGKGSRMNSGGLSKVLHEVKGMTMLDRVLQTLKQIGLNHHCLVLGEDWEAFHETLERFPDFAICIQKERNGTAGAVGSASSFFKGVEPIRYAPSELKKGKPVPPTGYTLVCYGDTPMIKASVLKDFIKYALEQDSQLCVLGMQVPNPKGYGRLIIDNENFLKAIVEEKDASEEQKKIKFCNSGIILARTSLLFECLKSVSNQNSQNEYYLTDTIAIAGKNNHVNVYITEDWQSFIGVNTKEQLLQLEENY